jgi:putative endonuclease
MTSDLPKRIWQHNHHFFKNCYTAKRLPIELVYTGVFEDVHDATAWERRIKKWSRKKKEALFIGDRDRLKSLAARHSTVNVVQDFKRKFRKMYASYCYAVSF